MKDQGGNRRRFMGLTDARRRKSLLPHYARSTRIKKHIMYVYQLISVIFYIIVVEITLNQIIVRFIAIDLMDVWTLFVIFIVTIQIYAYYSFRTKKII